MQKMIRIGLVLALVMSLCACQSRPKTVVIVRGVENMLEVRDVCGLGITSVGVYPSGLTGPVEDADALWGVRVKTGASLLTRVSLWGNVEGYQRFGRMLNGIPDGTDYYVLVDNSSQFYDAQALPSGRVAWNGREYSSSGMPELIQEIEAQDPSLKGRCG